MNALDALTHHKSYLSASASEAETLNRLLNTIGYLLPGLTTIRRMQKLIAGHTPTCLGISEAQCVQFVGCVRCGRPVISTIACAIKLTTLRISRPGMRGIKHIGIVCLDMCGARLEPVQTTII